MMEEGKCEIHSKASGRLRSLFAEITRRASYNIMHAADFLIYFLLTSLLYHEFLFFFFNFFLFDFLSLFDFNITSCTRRVSRSHCTCMPRSKDEFDNVQQEVSLSFTYVTLCLSLDAATSISDPDFSISA